MDRHLIVGYRAHGTKQLTLFISYRVGGKAHRWLHCRKASKLQQMILKHVADNAGFVVVPSAGFYADRFGGGNLHMIDVAPIPDRLEHGIGEAEYHDVLHGFFAEIVIDPIDLFFIQRLMHAPVELAASGRQPPHLSTSSRRRRD